MIFRWSFVEQRTTYRSISSQKLPGFVVEFDIYNIYANDPMLLTLFLHEVPQFKYTGFYALSKVKEGIFTTEEQHSLLWLEEITFKKSQKVIDYK